MSLPDDYQVEKVTSALAEIKIYIAWDFDGVDELYVWLQNSVDGTVYYQELGDFTVTEDSDGGGVFILVENNQGVSVDVSVARTTPKTQTYSLNNGEALNPEALIESLDKTVKMIQDESEGYDNQNITSVNPYVVPDKVTRANKICGFDDDGEFALIISDIGAYRNKYIPAGDMIARATDGATPGSSESATNKVMTEYFEFPAGVETFSQFSIMLPDEWDKDDIKIKLYWTGGSSLGVGVINWGVYVGPINHDDDIDTAIPFRGALSGQVLGSITALQVAGGRTLAIDNNPTNNCLLYFQISRDGSGILDTYTEDARLLGVGLQYKESVTPVVVW